MFKRFKPAPRFFKLRTSLWTKWLLVVVATISFCLTSAAQSAEGDSAKTQIIILRADRLNMQKQNDTTQLTSLGGNALVQQATTLFSADSIVLNKTKNILEAFGHVHINDRDSVHIYSDYLKYLSKERKAHLEGSVKLTDNKSTITTPDLDYDVNTKTGIYLNYGKVVTGRSVLTSKEAYYYGETKDIYFKRKVLMVDTDYTVKTDTLLYNSNTDIATFVVPTEIISSGRKVYTKDGYYDLANKKAYFGKRSRVQDSTTFLIGDEIASDSSGFGEARGNVVYRDTSQGTTLFCNNLKTNRKEGSFLATLKPVMVLKQGGDSIFIAADTLYSAKLTDLRKYRHVPMIDTLPQKDSAELERDSSNRFFEAYYHVRIFSDSLQAVGDSLFYSGEDSAFRLFKQPILWAKNSQVTGDTIYLYTKNKKPKRMYVFENGLAISKADSIYYNQLKGRTINGLFNNDGEINYMRARGNAQSVYYGQDDYNKFVSVNSAQADIIDMYFEDRKPNKVVMRSSVEGTAYPMRQVNHEELRLKGFKWLDKTRPKSKFEFVKASEAVK